MDTRDRKDIIGAVIITFVVLFVLIVGFVVLKWPQDTDVEYHAILLIDHSDPFSSSQLQSIKNDISHLRKELLTDEKVGKRISVFAIEGVVPSIPTPFISISRHKQPMLMTKNRWERKTNDLIKDFDEKMEIILAKPNESAQSPIMEYIRHIGQWDDFKDSRLEKRFLIIYSDLVENVEPRWIYNQQMPPFENFKNTRHYQGVKTNLEGIIVKVRYLRRKQYAGVQTEKHHEFWENYFLDAGVKLSDLEIVEVAE